MYKYSNSSNNNNNNNLFNDVVALILRHCDYLLASVMDAPAFLVEAGQIRRQ